MGTPRILTPPDIESFAVPTDAPGPPHTSVPQIPWAPTGRVHGTLAVRIALVTTAVALLTALIVAAVSVPQIRSAATVEAQQSLARAADSVVNSIQPGVGGPQIQGRTLVRLRSGEIAVYQIANGGDAPSFLTGSDLAVLFTSGSLSVVTQVGDEPLLVEGRALNDGSYLLFTEPVSVALGSSARDVARLLIALAAGVVIAVVAGLVLARRIARPLKVAATAANEMARGHRDVVIRPQGPVEVAEVAESLNDLNAALTISEARQREFLLSVSHELRTPLTSIRGYSEALADGVVDAADVPATASLLTSEAARLDRLVADLLDLARMGAREVRIDAASVDVAPMLADAAAVWGDRCEAEGVDFTADLPSEPIVMITDPVRLRQILDNLLANALRMTPPGRPIVLAAHADAADLVIDVRDGGPGLTPDDIDVAFEPAELYSRYRGVRAVGSGVGLALVGRLAHRLGGNATAGQAPEGGARFTITLPTAGSNHNGRRNGSEPPRSMNR